MIPAMPPEPLINVGFSEHGSTLVVAVAGELDLASAPELADALGDVDWEEFDRVVFDLQEVDFLDSSGLGALIALRNNNPDTDISIVTNSDGLVPKLLRLTAMEELFSVYSSREAALA